MNLPRLAVLFAAAWFVFAATSVSAQAPVERPALISSDAPVVLSSSEPLRSLEYQIKGSDFDRRGALSSAFDEISTYVDLRVSALQARGVGLVDEAEGNLSVALDIARNAFRDLSLTTEETWHTAQENAVLALRRIRGALEDLERTATVTPQ